MAGDRSDAATELIGVLAHELRNPLASLQGCAATLLDRADELPVDVRHGLTSVIVRQSRRMEWLIGALAAFGGATRRVPSGDVPVGTVVQAAAEAAGIGVHGVDDVHGAAFPGDERRFRLALEALFVSLLDAGAEGSANIREGGAALVITTSATDLTQGGRKWKIRLARRLLREEGCRLRVRTTTHRTVATVRFPAGAGGSDRRVA